MTDEWKNEEKSEARESKFLTIREQIVKLSDDYEKNMREIMAIERKRNYFMGEKEMMATKFVSKVANEKIPDEKNPAVSKKKYPNDDARKGEVQRIKLESEEYQKIKTELKGMTDRFSELETEIKIIRFRYRGVLTIATMGDEE